MSNEKTPRTTPPSSEPLDTKPGQIGEGSYEGTRDYQESIGTYLETADVAAVARAAQPANENEADELKSAEREGLSHSHAKGK